MSQTIGQLLQKKREKRGFSIADVAHDTHIHADTIRGLEADDYSVFSSTTYARSFLQLYSRHLEVDADEALHDFDSVSETLSSGNFSYLESATNAIEPGEAIHPHEDINHSFSYGDERKQTFPLFLAIVVFTLLLVIPVFYFIGKEAESLEEAGTIFKEALSPGKKTPVIDPNQPENTNNPVPVEPLAITKSPPTSQLAEKKPRSHRFPAPLPATGFNSTASSSAPPIKATPVKTENSLPKKTNTAQNRN